MVTKLWLCNKMYTSTSAAIVDAGGGVFVCVCVCVCGEGGFILLGKATSVETVYAHM